MDYEKTYLSFADKITESAVENARQGKVNTGLGSRPQEEQPKLDFSQDVQSKYMSFAKALFPEKTESKKFKTQADPEVGLEELYIIDEEKGPQRRPQSRSDVVPEAIKNDPEFGKQIKRLTEKFGITETQIYKVIQGESAFKPKATNKSGASGLFQFMPKTAADLGWTTEEILDMAPAEQAKVYEQYLDFWGYDGSNALGIMQAAPAYANAAPETVIYKKGTKAWKQNPGWRPASGGDITVADINNYYRKQGL